MSDFKRDTILSYFSADPEVEEVFRTGVDACIQTFHEERRSPNSLDDWCAELSESEVPVVPWTAERYLAVLRDQVVAGAIRVGKPRFVGHMTSALPSYLGHLSRLLTVLNQNVVKIETSNVLTLIERQVLGMMHRVAFGQSSDFYREHLQNKGSHLGIVTSCGTLANMTAMWLARNHAMRSNSAFLGHQTSGLIEGLQHYDYRDAVVIGSELMHYSMEKLGSIMGFGHEQVLKVSCDENGKIMTGRLEELIEQCRAERRLVVALVGIAATTETGAVDDLDALADVAARYKLHFHVDAAWGGPILFSDRHRHLLKGIERADTVTICGHKQLYLPQGISMVLCRDPHLVQHIRALARYQARAESFDLGKHSAEGSRPANALYAHASLHLIGQKGYAYLIDEGIRKARLFADLVDSNPAFELIQDPTTNLVVYRYLPADLREVAALGKLTRGDELVVNSINEVLQNRQYEEGNTFISRTGLRWGSVSGTPRIVLRAVFANPLTTEAHLAEVLDEQEALAELVLRQATMSFEDVLKLIYSQTSSVDRQ